jgi:hypothetical protein
MCTSVRIHPICSGETETVTIPVDILVYYLNVSLGTL